MSTKTRFLTISLHSEDWTRTISKDNVLDYMDLVRDHRTMIGCLMEMKIKQKDG